MYAVIVTGGKQYKVKAGDVVKVEKIEQGIGDAVTFDKVLMVMDGDDVKLGTPYLDGQVVKAEVVEQGRHKKVRIIKFRRRKHSMKRMGHRQYYTTVKITEVGGKKAVAKPAAAKAKPVAKAATKPVEKKAAATAKPAAAKKPATTGAKKAAPATKKPAATAKKATTTAKPAVKKTAATTTSKTTAAKKPAAKKTTTAAKKPAAKK